MNQDAVVFYETPFDSLRRTLGGVFGDGDLSSGTGMTVEELLEGIDARLVYIPLYGCTSFVTEQVMNNFFRRFQSHEEKMDPICVFSGFGFSDEQWELDWVDVELSPGFCRSTTTTEHEDNIILRQDEEQDAEESFVTANSPLSDDSRSSHMCSPVSGAVFIKVDPSTPTIAPNTTITTTIIDAGHSIHVTPNLPSLSSMTNLISAGSIVTKSKCTGSGPKLCHQSTCSSEVHENPRLETLPRSCIPATRIISMNIWMLRTDIINSKSVNYNYRGFNHFSLGDKVDTRDRKSGKHSRKSVNGYLS
ncbi:hypothetical protein EV368DRAFT_65677 [Lentinula lateritia]|nr:hypothetical protein EV368DRAFT_65677 [Lentinula lateritia]